MRSAARINKLLAKLEYHNHEKKIIVVEAGKPIPKCDEDTLLIMITSEPYPKWVKESNG